MVKLRRASGPVDKRIMHWCPGCNEVHGYRVAGEGGPMWTFNGDMEKPTFTPSMLLFEVEDGKRVTLCHYFITDGKIIFCSDSPHALAGQTVDIPEWPYASGTYGGIEDS